ncbi:hypothetical protein CC79DRAFT_191867 [Sarocladium strictum]
MARSSHIRSFLAIIGQGIEGDVCILPECIDIPAGARTRENGFGPERDRRLRSDQEIVSCTLPHERNYPRLRSGIYGRRILASVVHFHDPSPGHWGCLIYDRQERHLYFYDTLRDGVGARGVQVALAWRMLLVNLGFAAEFRVVIIRAPTQPGSWQCGWLACVNLWWALRVQRGEPLSLATAGSNHKHIRVDAQHRETDPDIRAAQFRLRYADWTFGGVTQAAAWGRARSLLAMILSNELGVRSMTQVAGLVGATTVFDFCPAGQLANPARPLSVPGRLALGRVAPKQIVSYLYSAHSWPRAAGFGLGWERSFDLMVG